MITTRIHPAGVTVPTADGRLEVTSGHDGVFTGEYRGIRLCESTAQGIRERVEYIDSTGRPDPADLVQPGEATAAPAMIWRDGTFTDVIVRGPHYADSSKLVITYPGDIEHHAVLGREVWRPLSESEQAWHASLVDILKRAETIHEGARALAGKVDQLDAVIDVTYAADVDMWAARIVGSDDLGPFHSPNASTAVHAASQTLLARRFSWRVHRVPFGAGERMKVEPQPVYDRTSTSSGVRFETQAQAVAYRQAWKALIDAQAALGEFTAARTYWSTVKG